MYEHNAGRVFIIRSGESIDGGGSSPEEVATHASSSGAKYLIIDASDAAFVDTPGMRWLIKLCGLLDSAGKKLRIVSRSKSRVTRNIELLNVQIDRFDTVAGAWKTPWNPADEKRHRKRAA